MLRAGETGGTDGEFSEHSDWDVVGSVEILLSGHSVEARF